MPRYTLHKSKSPDAVDEGDVPAGLRSDDRVAIIAEMPRMLLIDCAEDVAQQWLAQMPGWKMQPEQRAKLPDPRPKLKP